MVQDDKDDQRQGPIAVERALVFLRDSCKREDSNGVSQREVSEGTGIRLSHIPRAMKKLKEEGWASESVGHAQGSTRQVKVYTPTGGGMKKAKEIIDRYGHDCFCSDRPKEEKVMEPSKDFLGRKEEIERIKNWMKKGSQHVLVIYGSAGIGKTALVKKSLDRIRSKKIFWFTLNECVTIKDAQESLSKTFGKIGEDEILPDFGPDAIVVFDNLFEVRDEMVEFLSIVADTVSKRQARMIVTARDNTPFYNRFYDARNDRSVVEMTIKGLSIKETNVLLGGDMDPESLHRIYQLTKGKPALIVSLREGDTENLAKNSRLDPEEIRLLMYLRTVRKNIST